MTAPQEHALHAAAARAALTTPGVAALQPGLTDRLAAVANRVHPSPRVDAAYLATPGIRVGNSSDGGWHVEVRCIIYADVRVLSTAQQVRRQVWDAVSDCLYRQSEPGSVVVTVTVTRTVFDY